jgi:PAS domain S-box-containing protein
MSTNPTPILLIDDDEDDYFITKDLLDEIEGQSFQLDWLFTYEAGLAAVKRQEHQAYLVDYRLGARNGLDLLREAIGAGITSPIILLTGQGDQEVDLEAMAAGAADYLVKDQLDALLLERSLRYAIAQKKAERALRESEARYRNVTELISDYAYVLRVGEDGRPELEWVSEEGFTRVTGYTLADLAEIGSWPDFSTYTHADDIPIVKEHWQQLFAGKQSVVEYRLITKDGSTCWLRVHVYPEWDTVQDRVVYVYGVAQDITEQKLAETVRRQLEEQLQQAQKMEAIGRLAGGIAHDFNNALTIILTCSELLLRRYLDDPAQAREYVEEIKEAGERTALLTRQLLAFSRKQVMLPRLINLSELIQNLERLLRRLIGEDVLLSTTLKQDIGLIKADPSQLEQVIMNLVVNARDAMPTGGKLLIETKSTYLDEQYAQQRVGLKAGPYSVLTVSDTGGGIDKETIARIFEPFFTTKTVGKGTGLGLAMVYGIVQQSGGEIQG